MKSYNSVRLFFLSGVFLLLTLTAAAQIVKGQVVYVSDGDTFHLLSENGEKIKIRVAEIDCPERAQAYGLEAKEFVMNEVKGQTVELVIIGTDRFERPLGRVLYGGKDLSEELVKHGFAWHYKQYSSDKQLAKLEQEARAKKVGLWKDPSPVAPWEFRKRK